MHIGPFQGVTLLVLEIKKIYQHIVNDVNLSVLKLEKRYLHQNGVEFNQKLNQSIKLESIQGQKSNKNNARLSIDRCSWSPTVGPWT